MTKKIPEKIEFTEGIRQLNNKVSEVINRLILEETKQTSDNIDTLVKDICSVPTTKSKTRRLIKEYTSDIFQKARDISKHQTVGRENDYYVTLEQLDKILK